MLFFRSVNQALHFLLLYDLVYAVEVLTGDVRGAGTDAHVFVTIYGDRGNTGRVQLVNRLVQLVDRSRLMSRSIRIQSSISEAETGTGEYAHLNFLHFPGFLV